MVFEAPTADLEAIADYFGATPVKKLLDLAPLSPVLRFLLDDDERRTFVAERMCYLGSIDGWLRIDGGPLEELAKRYVKHIGAESFFERMQDPMR